MCGTVRPRTNPTASLAADWPPGELEPLGLGRSITSSSVMSHSGRGVRVKAGVDQVPWADIGSDPPPGRVCTPRARRTGGRRSPHVDAGRAGPGAPLPPPVRRARRVKEDAAPVPPPPTQLRRAQAPHTLQAGNRSRSLPSARDSERFLPARRTSTRVHGRTTPWCDARPDMRPGLASSAPMPAEPRVAEDRRSSAGGFSGRTTVVPSTCPVVIVKRRHRTQTACPRRTVSTLAQPDRTGVSVPCNGEFADVRAGTGRRIVRSRTAGTGLHHVDDRDARHAFRCGTARGSEGPSGRRVPQSPSTGRAMSSPGRAGRGSVVRRRRWTVVSRGMDLTDDVRCRPLSPRCPREHLAQLGTTGAGPDALVFPAPESGPLRSATGAGECGSPHASPHVSERSRGTPRRRPTATTVSRFVTPARVRSSGHPRFCRCARCSMWRRCP